VAVAVARAAAFSWNFSRDLHAKEASEMNFYIFHPHLLLGIASHPFERKNRVTSQFACRGKGSQSKTLMHFLQKLKEMIVVRKCQKWIMS